MRLAKVIGTVVATAKYSTLDGIPLKILQPYTEVGKNCGTPSDCNQDSRTTNYIVACDPLHTRQGDIVLCVEKREASLAIPGALLVNSYPIDATITGLVDLIGDKRV